VNAEAPGDVFWESKKTRSSEKQIQKKRELAKARKDTTALSNLAPRHLERCSLNKATKTFLEGDAAKKDKREIAKSFPGCFWSIREVVSCQNKMEGRRTKRMVLEVLLNAYGRGRQIGKLTRTSRGGESGSSKNYFGAPRAWSREKTIRGT